MFQKMFNLTKNKLETDLLLIKIFSVLLILSIILIPDSPLRTILGFPFVLFFPGYTLLCVLFPAKTDLGGIERVALSIGLSLACVPLIGLALNYTPLGIRLTPIMATLFSFTVVMSILSFYKRVNLPPEQKFPLKVGIKTPKWRAIRRSDKLFTVGFLIAMFVVSSLIVYLVTVPKTGERFTEFYLLWSSGILADYPANLTLGESGLVTVGITNREQQNMTYRIACMLDNQTLGNIYNIQLSSGVNWSQNYTFTPKETGDKLKLEFTLYREDLAEPYRSLQLWVTVRPSP